MKRDCIFLLADVNMNGCFQGFLGRAQYHQSLGTRPFDFDPYKDIRIGKNDPDVYNNAHELLRPYLNSHRHAVVVLDQEYEGSPKAKEIRADISERLARNGWAETDFAVIVIDPELENWIWQDNPHVDRIFRFRGQGTMREYLAEKGLWPADKNKPPRPKEAVETLLRHTGVKRSSAVYRKITQAVSIKGCTDPSFLELIAALRRWFPRESL